MRIAVLFLLVGCVQPQPYDPPPPPDDGWVDTSGNPIGGCPFDCGNEVCARDGVCHPADAVRVVHARWTIDGAPASIETCASHPDLRIAFTDSSGDTRIGFSPVPCRNALFTVTLLPDVYSRVELGDDEGASATAVIDELGDAILDLP